MATLKRTTTLRVLSDDAIELAPGKFLPKGDYPGSISILQVAMRGQTVNHLGQVMLSLTEAQIAAALGEAPKSGLLGMDIDVASAYRAGAIKEV